jgi:aminoglycoside phosphotransferase family enzyme/predicted kinase
MTHPELVDSMTQNTFYPHAPEGVAFLQTHASYVFIAGDYVYKVKKPVDFGFLDFTSLEKRKFYCEEELRLNRRLASSIYLDIIKITEDSRGRLALNGEGRVVEYAVLMKRLPLERMLKILLAEGKADEDTLDAIAAKLAAFHRQAKTGGKIDEMGSISTIRNNQEENFDQTEKYRDITIPAYQFDFIKSYVEHFLETQKTLLEKRIADHRIRECHGDLHLEHICIADEIIIFDCIEFNERFRFGDVASDVAFLTMDFDYNGYTRSSETFTAAYLKHSGDRDMPAVLNFYRCYYAYVRGKVTSFRLDQKELPDSERDGVRQTALRYFDLAYSYAARLEKPVLILTAGTIGSGKSYQARHLASRLGAEVIRTDVLRKELLHIDPAERHPEAFGKGIYSPAISRRTYDEAFELGARKIAQGKPVIIDASFAKRSDRARAVELAERLKVPFYVVECVCPDEVVKTRLEKRKLENDNPSDGRWEILQDQKKHFESVDEIPKERYFRIDTSASPEQSRQDIVRAIRQDCF